MSKQKLTMREIKFRAQDIASNKWLYGDLRHHKDDVCIFEQGGTNGEQVKPNTVGQFIGLLDKDGREIYEGDIVTNRVHNYQVSYETSHTAAFVCKYKGLIAGCLGQLYAFESQYLTVIGNIHDTPELLNTR